MRGHEPPRGDLREPELRATAPLANGPPAP